MRGEPTAVRRVALDEIDSTNAEALRLARSGERGPVWITAKTQSAGRGRGGKAWASPAGNLYATLLLSEPATPAIAPQLAFVAGLAVRDAIVAVAPERARDLRFKWPNDVLLDGKKLAGVLIEAENVPVFASAIGIGVNCVSHPVETSYPATDLQGEASADAVFEALAASMRKRLLQWDEGRGFATIRADWLPNAAGLGEPMKVRLPDRELSGRFDGLDESGRLLLEAEGKSQTVAAGEVFALGGAR
jgi:BirA family biotin operon repressor/biotin-[acetyl-CoA-carboxylase] ligase